MDKYTEEQKLKELTIRILDNQEIVTRKDVSNLFTSHYDDVEELLRKWIKLNSTKALEIKYQCNGVHEKGYYLFQIADEKQNVKWVKKGFLSIIHSIVSKIGSSKSFNFDNNNILMKRILTDDGHRDYSVPEVEEEEVKTEKKIKSFFSLSTKSLKLVKPECGPEEEMMKIKNEPDPSTSKAFKGSLPQSESIVTSKISEVSVNSDKKETPKKSPDDTKKIIKKKDIKSLPPVAEKNSIASFFSNKPAMSSFKNTTEKAESKTFKSEEIECESVQFQESIEVMDLSDDEIPCTPEAVKPKKQILKKEDSQKRSRIIPVSESSEEDDPKEKAIKEPDPKVAKLDKKSSKIEPSQKKSDGKKSKIKSKKTKTESEPSLPDKGTEKASESTINSAEISKKPAKENEKPANAPKKLTKKEIKNQVPQNQGTITSFFNKK